MRKFISMLLMLCVFTAMAKVGSVYVNPIKNETDLNENVVNRLFKKGMLGYSKAKTVDVMTGPEIKAGSAEAANYDFILDMTIEKIDAVDLIGETKATIDEVMNIFGKGSGKDKKDEPVEFTATITTDVTVRDAKTGQELYNTKLAPSASDIDKGIAFFEATDNFDYDVLDMMDDAFAISGEIISVSKTNKKGEAKEVRVQLGSKDGVRKGQMFKIFKVTGDQKELIGMAKCEQVVNDNESALSIKGKKDGDKKLGDAFKDLGSSDYTLEIQSCSKSGFIRDNFQDLDKMFSKRERSHYLDPFGRTSKPRVGFLAVTATDPNAQDLIDILQKTVLSGLGEVTTIEVVPTIFKSVESARENGIDALFELTIDRITRDTKDKKDSKGNVKKEYSTQVFYSMDAIDVMNNRLIDMQSRWESSSSGKSAQTSDEKAVKNIEDYVRHFGEDLFPMVVTLVASTKNSKDEVKEALLEVNPNLGIKKGMHFDIYLQQKEGDEDARIQLGDGKVKGTDKDGNYIISVKGKNNGDKELLKILKDAKPDIEVIAISKTSYGVMGVMDQLLGN